MSNCSGDEVPSTEVEDEPGFGPRICLMGSAI